MVPKLPVPAYRLHTLKSAERFFLNQASLEALAAGIGALAAMQNLDMTVVGVATGSYAEEAVTGKRGGQESGSMMTVGGRYKNHVDDGTITRKLEEPNMIRGFGTVYGRRMGFSIPVNPDYSLDRTRALSASYPFPYPGISYLSRWEDDERDYDEVPQLNSGELEIVEVPKNEIQSSTHANRVPALYLALCRVAIVSGVGLDWIKPLSHKPGLIQHQAEVAA